MPRARAARRFSAFIRDRLCAKWRGRHATGIRSARSGGVAVGRLSAPMLVEDAAMRFTPDTPADRKVIVTEVGTRDGFQAEPAFIPTATKAAILMALVDAGVASFEATSFVSPRAVPQMADAAELMRRVDRRAGVRLQALVPNAKGAQAAAAVRVDMMVCFLSASESHNQANLSKPIAAS